MKKCSSFKNQLLKCLIRYEILSQMLHSVGFCITVCRHVIMTQTMEAILCWIFTYTWLRIFKICQMRYGLKVEFQVSLLVGKEPWIKMRPETPPSGRTSSDIS